MSNRNLKEGTMEFLAENWIWFASFFVIFMFMNMFAFAWNVEMYFLTMFIGVAVFFIWIGTLF